MDIYFVRHGQTDGNIALRHQHEDTSLNAVGRLQAEKVAKRIAKIRPTNIVSSTNLRAIETTRIIVEKCINIPPETHPAFEELKRPRRLIGTRFVSLRTFWYMWRWFFGLKIKEGGESYVDFLARINEARTLLESMPENSRVVIVSHSVFINLFLEHICDNQPMNLIRAVRRIIKILTLHNTSVIHLCYQRVQNGCGWKILTK